MSCELPNVVHSSFENGKNKSRGKSRPTFTSRVMYSHVLVVDLTYDKYRILNRIHVHDIKQNTWYSYSHSVFNNY